MEGIAQTSILTVETPATVTALCERTRVKSELNITDANSDERLDSMIARASGRVVEYCRIAPADDGTRNLGIETLVETIRIPILWPHMSRSILIGPETLLLSRRPVRSITSVVEDGITLDPTDYEARRAAGILTRLTADDIPIRWCARKIVVTYTAGWKLPGETGRNLPRGAEDVCLALAKAEYFAAGRDPAVKMVRVEGLSERSYFMRGDAPIGGLEEQFAQALDATGLVETWF